MILIFLHNVGRREPVVLEALWAGTFDALLDRVQVEQKGTVDRWERRRLVQAFATSQKEYGPDWSTSSGVEMPRSAYSESELEAHEAAVAAGRTPPRVPIHAARFRIERVEIHGATAAEKIANMERELRSRSADPYQCLIQGTPSALAIKKGESEEGCPRRLKDRDGQELFADRPQYLLTLDIDKAPLPAGLDGTTFDAVDWVIRNRLPQLFHDAALCYQFSSSSGKDPSVFSGHLFFILERAATLAELRTWAKWWNEQTGGDLIDSQVLRPVQPIYVCAPTFEDPNLDPFAGKCRFGFKAGHALPPHAFTVHETPEDLQRKAEAFNAAPATRRNKILVDGGTWREKLDQIGQHIHGPITAAAWALVMENGPKASEMALDVQNEARRIYAEMVASGQRKAEGSDEANLANIPADIEGLIDKQIWLKRTPERADHAAARLKNQNEATFNDIDYEFSELVWTAYQPALRSKPFDEVDETVMQNLAKRAEPLSQKETEDLQKVRAKVKAQADALAREAVDGRRIIRYPKTEVSSLDQIPTRQTGITFVRAGHGAGKTELVAGRAKDEAERAIHISPRVSISHDVAKRLKLANYKTGLMFPNIPGAQPVTGLATCVPSLAKQDVWDFTRKGDLIIIDELKSLLALLLNPTMGKQPAEAFERFKLLLQYAPSVMILDADLSDREIDFILSWSGRNDYRIYEMPADMKGFTFTAMSYDTFTKAPPPELSEGKRVLLYSESERLTKKCPWLCAMVESGEALVISQPNKDNVQEILRDPNAALKNHQYKLIVCTPTVDTGWSVTEDIADSVYFLSHGVLPPEGQLQMMRRYRLAREITIVHGPSIPRGPNSAGVIVAGYQALHARAGNFNWQVDGFSYLCAEHGAYLASRQRLGSNGLIDILRDEGATLTWLDDGVVDVQWRKAMAEHFKSINEAEAVELVENEELEEPRREFRRLYKLKPDAPLDVEMVLWHKEHGPKTAERLHRVLSPESFDEAQELRAEACKPDATKQWTGATVNLIREALAEVGIDAQDLSSIPHVIDHEATQRLFEFIKGRWTAFSSARILKLEQVVHGELVALSPTVRATTVLTKLFHRLGWKLLSNNKRGEARTYTLPPAELATSLAMINRERPATPAVLPDWSAFDTKLGRAARDVLAEHKVLPMNTGLLVRLLDCPKFSATKFRKRFLADLPPHLRAYNNGNKQPVVASIDADEEDIHQRVAELVATVKNQSQAMGVKS